MNEIARIAAAALPAALLLPAIAAAGPPPCAYDDISGWIDLGIDALLGAGESVSADAVPPAPLVVGWEMSFDYDEPVPDASWASDLRVEVAPPAGAVSSVGGLSTPPETMWSFQGPVSDGPGTYGADGEDVQLPWPDDPQAADTFTITLINDWDGDANPNRYSNVLIRFYLRDPCREDIDGDGEVEFDDLLAVLSYWGPCDLCPEDIDCSGDVGFSDLLLVLARWGPCPPPE